MKTGADAGLLFVSPLRVHMRCMVRLHFATSNNVAEYEALINGLQVTIELGVRRLDIQGDSQLIVDQVMKESNCLDPKMEAYYKLVRRLEDKFDGLELNHIARKYNEAADELAKMASAWAPVPPNVFARDLHKPSIDYASVAEEGPPAEPTAGLDAPSAAETPSAEPEVMEVDTGPPRPTRTQTGESHSLIGSLRESFLVTGPKPNGLRDKPKLTSSATANCTGKVPLVSSNDASPPR